MEPTDMFTFDTGLTEDVFAKTRLVEHLTEPGVVATVSGGTSVIATASDERGGKQSLIPLEFTFKPWAFNGTQMQAGHVILCGEVWGKEPVPLLDMLGDNKDAVCAVVNAMQGSSEIPPVGAGGIYVSADMQRVLFLPPTLFDQVVSLRGAEEYARQQGWWMCKALLSKGNRSLSVSEASAEDVRVGEPVEPRNDHDVAFTIASLAYCALTGKPPYDDADEVARDADIYDKQYLPLELAINGIDPQLAAAVDAALDAPGELLHTAERARHSSEQRPSLRATAEQPPIDTAILHRELTTAGRRQQAVSDDEFAARVTEYHKAQEKRTKANRTLRRNRAAITAAVIGAVTLVMAVFFGYRDAMGKPTMQGLTDMEVAAVFYRAMNEQDVQMVTMAARGKASHEFGDGLSQVFVSGRMRGMYGEGGIVTLEEWLERNAAGAVPSTIGVYGLTNVKIDGAACNYDVQVPIKRERPIPVGKSDPGVTEGSTAQHTARYYFVHTEGENQDFMCQRHTDKMTLTYTRNKWRVSDVVQDTEDVEVDSAAFRADTEKAIAECGGDAAAAAARLKDKYVWLPDLR